MHAALQVLCFISAATPLPCERSNAYSSSTRYVLPSSTHDILPSFRLCQRAGRRRPEPTQHHLVYAHPRALPTLRGHCVARFYQQAQLCRHTQVASYVKRLSHQRNFADPPNDRPHALL